MNNVTRVAGVFFIKTIYTILLSIICVFTNTPFPFIPLQITLIDLFIEAMPSFLTMFESDTRKIKGAFLPQVFTKALPNGISIIICFMLVMMFYPRFSFDYLEAVTIMYIVLGVVSMVAVIRSCIPFTNLRVIVCTLMILGFISAVVVGAGHLNLAVITQRIGIYAIGVSFIGLVIERLFYSYIKKNQTPLQAIPYISK